MPVGSWRRAPGECQSRGAGTAGDPCVDSPLGAGRFGVEVSVSYPSVPCLQRQREEGPLSYGPRDGGRSPVAVVGTYDADLEQVVG